MSSEDLNPYVRIQISLIDLPRNRRLQTLRIEEAGDFFDFTYLRTLFSHFDAMVKEFQDAQRNSRSPLH